MIQTVAADRTDEPFHERILSRAVGGRDHFGNPEHVLTDDRRWELEHRTAGRVTTLGAPVVLSDSPARLRRPPPLMGEHTDEILRTLGFDAGEIDAMRKDGAI